MKHMFWILVLAAVCTPMFAERLAPPPNPFGTGWVLIGICVDSTPPTAANACQVKLGDWCKMVNLPRGTTINIVCVVSTFSAKGDNQPPDESAYYIKVSFPGIGGIPASWDCSATNPDSENPPPCNYGEGTCWPTWTPACVVLTGHLSPLNPRRIFHGF